jgi:hypothetical protein
MGDAPGTDDEDGAVLAVMCADVRYNRIRRIADGWKRESQLIDLPGHSGARDTRYPKPRAYELEFVVGQARLVDRLLSDLEKRLMQSAYADSGVRRPGRSASKHGSAAVHQPAAAVAAARIYTQKKQRIGSSALVLNWS